MRIGIVGPQILHLTLCLVSLKCTQSLLRCCSFWFTNSVNQGLNWGSHFCPLGVHFCPLGVHFCPLGVPFLSFGAHFCPLGVFFWGSHFCHSLPRTVLEKRSLDPISAAGSLEPFLRGALGGWAGAHLSNSEWPKSAPGRAGRRGSRAPAPAQRAHLMLKTRTVRAPQRMPMHCRVRNRKPLENRGGLRALVPAPAQVGGDQIPVRTS